MKHSTDQRAHRPTSSPPLRSNLQLYLTHNINNLIYFFPALAFAYPTDSAQTHRGRRAPPFSYLCLQEMRATQHSIKTLFCTNDPTTSFSIFFVLSSSSLFFSQSSSVEIYFPDFVVARAMKQMLRDGWILWRVAGGKKNLVTIPGDEINKSPARSGIIRTQIPLCCVPVCVLEGLRE